MPRGTPLPSLRIPTELPSIKSKLISGKRRLGYEPTSLFNKFFAALTTESTASEFTQKRVTGGWTTGVRLSNFRS